MVVMRILDSHLHLWDPAILTYGWLDDSLRRRFGPEELMDALGAAPRSGNRAFVFVQAECAPEESLAEVDWVSSIASAAGVRGIVARAPIEEGEAVADILERLGSRALVVGIRRNLQDEPVGFALRDRFVEGARRVARAGLVFDACVRPHQLADVAVLADAVPRLTIVLDHLGKPVVGSSTKPVPPGATSWDADVRRLAARPNVVCKLSGLPAESSGEWTAEQLTPFLDAALDSFGPDRLLFGSDWPVSVRGGYLRWAQFVTAWVSSRLGPMGVDGVLWRNAARVYGLA
jgi:L-fuconolactonase